MADTALRLSPYRAEYQERSRVNVKEKGVSVSCNWSITSSE